MIFSDFIKFLGMAGIKSSTPISLTWAEMDQLRQDSAIIPEQAYDITNYQTRRCFVNGDRNLILDGNGDPIYHSGPVRTIRVIGCTATTIYEHNAVDLGNPTDIIHYQLSNVRWENGSSGGYDNGPQTGIIYYREDTRNGDKFDYDWRSFCMTAEDWADYVTSGYTAWPTGVIPARMWESVVGNGMFCRVIDPGNGEAYRDLPMFNPLGDHGSNEVRSHRATALQQYPTIIPVICLWSADGNFVYKYQQGHIGMGTEWVGIYYPNGEISNSQAGCCSQISLYHATGSLSKFVSGPNEVITAYGSGLDCSNSIVQRGVKFTDCSLTDCTVTTAWPYAGISGTHEKTIFAERASYITGLGPERVKAIQVNVTNWSTDGTFDNNNEILQEVSPLAAVVGDTYVIDVFCATNNPVIGSVPCYYGGALAGNVDKLGWQRFVVGASTTAGVKFDNSEGNFVGVIGEVRVAATGGRDDSFLI